VTLILESDCTLVSTVLLLLVESLEVSAVLRFNIVVVVVVCVVVVITRCRAARRVAVWIVLGLMVVWLSMWDVEHVDGRDRVLAKAWDSPLDCRRNYLNCMSRSIVE
jgi:hypothetical protein